MPTMNREMLKHYSRSLFSNHSLDHKLFKITEPGFVYRDGCYFLYHCINIETNVTFDDFIDKTGYECFINSIYIDDHVESDYLQQGIAFIKRVFSIWNKQGEKQNLTAILSIDEFSLKVKFHVQRQNEQWLSSDLESYEQPIMVICSSDSCFSAALRS